MQLTKTLLVALGSVAVYAQDSSVDPVTITSLASSIESQVASITESVGSLINSLGVSSSSVPPASSSTINPLENTSTFN